MVIAGEFGVRHEEWNLVLAAQAGGLGDLRALAETVEPIKGGHVAQRVQVLGQPVFAWRLGGGIYCSTGVELIHKAIDEAFLESMGMPGSIAATILEITPCFLGQMMKFLLQVVFVRHQKRFINQSPFGGGCYGAPCDWH